MTEKTPVLIVGAGPTGLTMAIALERHGIDFRIIDKRSEPVPTSNALAIHPRTMEMLDDLKIISPFIKNGQRIDYLSLNRGKTCVAKLATSQIESFYNFILSIPQNTTEKILNHHLERINHRIERNTSLTAIEKNENGMLAEIIDENEEATQIKCEYLIACDGSHSSIRQLLGVKFKGIDIEQQFILADADIPPEHPDNEFTLYFHEDGPLAIFPFKKGKARVLATMINPNHDPKQPVSLLEMQTTVDKRSEGLFQINSANWLSSFWIHSRMLDRFREGNIFFLGDAAHIHSPIGGQGMNTGMQDAYNLAWKLALILKNKANSHLLDSFNEERYPNAEALLVNTERMTTMILVRNRFLQWLRRKLIRFALKYKRIQHIVAMELSMLNIRYEKSSIINYEFHISSRSPLPGHRAPDVYYTDRTETKRIDDLLRTTKHSLLIFTGKNPNKSEITEMQKIKEWANSREQLLQSTIIVHPTATHEFSDDEPVDSNHDLHIAYHANSPCYFMIRPDNYIGCCSTDLNLQLLNNYWKHIFKV